MSGAALVIALLLPPQIPAAAFAPSAPAATALHRARLALWGTQSHWDQTWQAFTQPEAIQYKVVQVWERYETPAADGPAPSFIIMREMDCGQHAWRTTGIVSYPEANLAGQARYEATAAPWTAAGEAGAEADSIYGSVCRR